MTVENNRGTINSNFLERCWLLFLLYSNIFHCSKKKENEINRHKHNHTAPLMEIQIGMRWTKIVQLDCWNWTRMVPWCPTIKLIVSFILFTWKLLLHFAKINEFVNSVFLLLLFFHFTYLFIVLYAIVVVDDDVIFLFLRPFWNKNTVRVFALCKQGIELKQVERGKKSTRHVYRLTLIRKRYTLNITWWRIKHECEAHTECRLAVTK